jgi:hypothetical protein
MIIMLRDEVELVISEHAVEFVHNLLESMLYICLWVRNFYQLDFIDYKKKPLKMEIHHFKHNVV